MARLKQLLNSRVFGSRGVNILPSSDGRDPRGLAYANQAVNQSFLIVSDRR